MSSSTLEMKEEEASKLRPKSLRHQPGIGLNLGIHHRQSLRGGVTYGIWLPGVWEHRRGVRN